MSRGRAALAEGLRRADLRQRMNDERSDRKDRGAQDHQDALEALRDLHVRRIAEARRKASAAPVAAEALEELSVLVTKKPLAPRTVRFLSLIEACLAEGKDIEKRAKKPRPPLLVQRPAWMADASLLPRRPPGGR